MALNSVHVSPASRLSQVPWPVVVTKRTFGSRGCRVGANGSAPAPSGGTASRGRAEVDSVRPGFVYGIVHQTEGAEAVGEAGPVRSAVPAAPEAAGGDIVVAGPLPGDRAGEGAVAGPVQSVGVHVRAAAEAA